MALLPTPCFAHHMAVVVNKDNVAQNFSSAHLAKIFKGEVKKWPDGKNVVLVLHNSSAGEMATLEHLTKMSEAEMKAVLARKRMPSERWRRMRGDRCSRVYTGRDWICRGTIDHRSRRSGQGRRKTSDGVWLFAAL